MGRANIAPRRRDTVLRRYSAPSSTTSRSLEPVGVTASRLEQADVDSATCPGCGYTYRVQLGAPREGFAPGTPWSAVPDSWCCPDCGVRDKLDFVVHAPSP